MFAGTALSVRLFVCAVYLCLLYTGLTCMWLYAYSMRITLHQHTVNCMFLYPAWGEKEVFHCHWKVVDCQLSLCWFHWFIGLRRFLWFGICRSDRIPLLRFGNSNLIVTFRQRLQLKVHVAEALELWLIQLTWSVHSIGTHRNVAGLELLCTLYHTHVRKITSGYCHCTC